MTLEEISQQLRIPPEDAEISVNPQEAVFIYDFLKKEGLKKTLEVGLAYARSASHIIAATNSMHITIDPFQSHYKDLGLQNLNTLGLSDKLTFHRDFSHSVLPKLLDEGGGFEFIFIDGDHKFDVEFVDFFYADLLVEDNGYILLHDTWMRSTRLVMEFIKKNRKEYKYIRTPSRNLALYQKLGKDNRNSMHFKEFYTLKSMITHAVIQWLKH